MRRTRWLTSSDPPLGADAQPDAGQQAKAKAWQQTQRERLADHEGDLLGFIDISADHQHVAVFGVRRAIARIVWCSRRSRSILMTSALCADASTRQIRWRALEVAGDAATVGAEYRRELHAAGILPQALFNGLEPPFCRQVGDPVHLRGDYAVGAHRQIVVDLQ